MKFGGLGGIRGGRDLDTYDRFEMAVYSCLGQQMRADDSWCVDVWGSLANCGWQHTNGDTASYSFRAAGDLIAAVVGRGDYLDWYCSSDTYGVPVERVAVALSGEGWFPDAETRRHPNAQQTDAP